MKNTTLVLATIVTAALLLQPHEVVAEVPETIPIQGRLTDADGTPIDGDRTLHFTLYDAADNEIFSESQIVSVDNGDFTAYLGEILPLDTSLIDGEISLGIAVGDEVEMTPRIPFGSVPFAINTPQLPTGLVSYFDLPTCPEGWSTLEEAAGRTIVGVGEGGTLLGQVSTPLGDLENRPHNHTVDPPAFNIASSGSHSHGIPAQNGLNTGNASVPHSHGIPALTGVTDLDEHNHRTINGSHTYNSSGTANVPLNSVWTNPPGVYVLSGSGANSRYTSNDEHDHEVTTNASNTNSTSSTSHPHPFSVPAHNTANDGNHIHSINVPSVSTTSASSSMPYVQLLACRKD